MNADERRHIHGGLRTYLFRLVNQVIFYHLLQFSYFQFSSVPILFRFRATARPMFSFRDTVRPITTQTRPPWHHSVLVQPAIAYSCLIRSRLRRDTSFHLVSQIFLWVGSGGLIRALDEPYKAHDAHTFGLKSSDFSFGFRLN